MLIVTLLGIEKDGAMLNEIGSDNGKFCLNSDVDGNVLRSGDSAQNLLSWSDLPPLVVKELPHLFLIHV